MTERDLADRIAGRLAAAGVATPGETVEQLAGYLELLARWNQRINLTAYSLQPISDEAIDRLLVEPVAAAARVGSGDRRLMDVGSGGGSPALPLRITRPQLDAVLVESKARKCAFLREAVRRLGLERVDVEQHRLEELAERRDLLGSADIVTIRAVRADALLWGAVSVFLRPGGRVFWFTAATGPIGDAPRHLAVVSAESLVEAIGSRLVIVESRWR